jgi:hypothetical protein
MEWLNNGGGTEPQPLMAWECVLCLLHSKDGITPSMVVDHSKG